MFHTSDLARILSASVLQSGPEQIISEIAIDSRQLTSGDHALFVALPGNRTDGHLYLEHAWQHGVRNFVVHSPPQVELPGSHVFLVEDSLDALQTLAREYRGCFDIPCIGITGSNGKTWVKEWLTQLLAPDEYIARSPRSYNSQVGVPLSVFRLRDYHTIAVFEAGISQPGEMQKIARVIDPSIGIFTHFGDAHAAGFKSEEQKFLEKCKLFTNADVIICAGHDHHVVNNLKAHFPGKRVISWGEFGEADMRVGKILRSAHDAEIHYTFLGERGVIRLGFSDEASIHNALTCALTLLHLGYAPDILSERMIRLQPLNMRLEVHRLPNRCLLINDTYSLDLASLQVGLESLQQHGSGMKQALIITDIDQQRSGAYDEIARLLIKRGIDIVWTIGEESQAIASALAGQMQHAHFTDVHTFMVAAPWRSATKTAFLLKGARRFGLERAVRLMQARLHSARLEIDLNAMHSNLQFFKARLHPGTLLIAMVKAAAYGSGSSEIARFLEFNNVDMLGVAYVDEGIELREAGIGLPVLVMNPEMTQLDRMIEAGLEPEVYETAMLKELAAYCGSARKPVRVHLKCETGMNRLGFDMDSVNMVVDILRSSEMLKVASVFSHFAAAGDPREEEFTRTQHQRFGDFYDAVCHGIGYRPMRHLLNTDGILRYPEYQYEAVRLGIGLYGIGTGESAQYLEPVHALNARISQVRNLRTGQTVGYDRAYTADRDVRIATVNVGYADGIMRKAGQGRYAFTIHGYDAPVIGNVCMDMCMVDVTDIPGVAVGDEVEVFGARGSLERLAESCETIPYEILTGISQRIPRVFKFAW